MQDSGDNRNESSRSLCARNGMQPMIHRTPQQPWKRLKNLNPFFDRTYGMFKQHVLLALIAATMVFSTASARAAVLIDDHFTSDPIGNGWALSQNGADATGLTRTVTQAGSQITLAMDNQSGGSLNRGIGVLNTAAPATPGTDFPSGLSMTTTFAGGLAGGMQYRFGLVQTTTNTLGSVFVRLIDVGGGVSLDWYIGTDAGGTGGYSTTQTVGGASVNVSASDELRVLLTNTTITVKYYDAESATELTAFDNASLGIDLNATGNWDTTDAYTLGYLFGGVANNVSTSISLDRIAVNVIPEPATLGLLALGGLMIVTRRSK